MGIGDWGLGIGDWGLGPIPNPQSPIPNPQSPIPNFFIYLQNKVVKLYIIIKTKLKNLNIYYSIASASIKKCFNSLFIMALFLRILNIFLFKDILV